MRVQGIEASDTYQAILEKGIALGLAQSCSAVKRMLLRLGNERLGPPDAKILAAIEATDQIDRLIVLFTRAVDVASWEELMDVTKKHPRAPARQRGLRDK